jgi:predicted outer membrane repeat protein
MSFFSWLRSLTVNRVPRSRTKHRPASAPFRPKLENLEGRWLPSQVSLSVSSLADSGPGTLRAAILAADAGAPSDKFTRAVGGPATIRDTLVSGNSANRGGGILTGGGMTTIIGCTITGNTAADEHLSNGITLIGQGGGIFNEGGQLTAQHSLISGNSATEGGGIFNYFASVEVRDSCLTGNSATEGGAIYNDASGTLAVHGSTFSGNTASDGGGGLYNLGTATLQESTLSGNSAGSGGGGIFNHASGALTLNDSVVVNNIAPLGADLYNLGVFTLNDSTVGVIGP